MTSVYCKCVLLCVVSWSEFFQFCRSIKHIVCVTEFLSLSLYVSVCVCQSLCHLQSKMFILHSVLSYDELGVCSWLRKGEVQWMSLALVGDEWHPPSGLKISAPITPHGMYFPSTPLPSPPSLLLPEMDIVGWC